MIERLASENSCLHDVSVIISVAAKNKEELEIYIFETAEEILQETRG